MSSKSETDFAFCINSLYSTMTEQLIYTIVLFPATLRSPGYTCSPNILIYLHRTQPL